MRSGKVVNTVAKKDTNQQELSMMMIGRHVVDLKLKEHEAGKQLLTIEHLTAGSIQGKKVLDDINLHVDAGEIVGIAGVSGNGQSELVQCITGLNPQYTGKIIVNGVDVSNKDVTTIRKAGQSHIPEDRYYWGSARDVSLLDNTLMGQQDDKKYNNHGLLRLKEIRNRCNQIIKQ